MEEWFEEEYEEEGEELKSLANRTQERTSKQISNKAKANGIIEAAKRNGNSYIDADSAMFQGTLQLNRSIEQETPARSQK